MFLDKSDIESNVEDAVSECKEIHSEQKKSEDILSKVKDSISKLAEDVLIQKSLEKNADQQEKNLEALQQRKEMVSERINELVTSLNEQKQKDKDSLSELNALEAIGEDVTEGKTILEERNNWIDACLSKLGELDEELGQEFDRMDKKMSSIVEEGSSEQGKESIFKKVLNKFTGRKQDDGAMTMDSEGISTDFSGFQACHLKGNDWLIAGSGYDAYRDYYDHYDQYTVSTDPKEEHIEWIDPKLIEGISISSRDIENPNLFWGQHKTDGTMDSFKEIASQIPKVKERLDQGASLDSLFYDEELGACASIYYDMDSPSAVRVLKGDGFYEFETNGRHRILAARALGYDIPVKIVGTIKSKSKRNQFKEQLKDYTNYNDESYNASFHDESDSVRQRSIYGNGREDER